MLLIYLYHIIAKSASEYRYRFFLQKRFEIHWFLKRAVL